MGPRAGRRGGCRGSEEQEQPQLRGPELFAAGREGGGAIVAVDAAI